MKPVQDQFCLYLLLNYGVQNAVDISGHAFSITTDIYITTLGDGVPDVHSLKTRDINIKKSCKIFSLFFFQDKAS